MGSGISLTSVCKCQIKVHKLCFCMLLLPSPIVMPIKAELASNTRSPWWSRGLEEGFLNTMPCLSLQTEAHQGTLGYCAEGNTPSCLCQQGLFKSIYWLCCRGCPIHCNCVAWSLPETLMWLHSDTTVDYYSFLYIHTTVYIVCSILDSTVIQYTRQFSGAGH